MRLTVREGLTSDPSARPFELVERKGIGHPDTLCDAISEAVSRNYTNYCLQHFDAVAHHWFDKVMLFGAGAELRYGHGRLTRPYTVMVFGKCAMAVGGEAIPLEQLVEEAAREVLSSRLTGFDPAEHLVVRTEVVDHTGPERPTSRYNPRGLDDLASLGGTDFVSNDSTLLVGYSPRTALEDLVLTVERFLNGSAFKARCPHIGWDIKVLGSRVGRSARLVANVPFIADLVDSHATYQRLKERLRADILAWAQDHGHALDELTINPADREGHGYLVALGSVADTGDVGATGRGNRINGLITPMRPMGIEAPAGKNPLDHTGKLYGLVAQDVAETLAAQLGCAVEVFIHTAKERPLDSPTDVMVNVALDGAADHDHVAARAVERALGALDRQRMRLVAGDVEMW